MTITLKLKSKGLTGTEYIKHLEKKGFSIGTWAENISKQVNKTKKDTSYEIIIFNFDKDYVTTQEVQDEAQKRGYIAPPVEVSYLLREELSDNDLKEMGLTWLIIMHEPITGSDDDPRLLGLDRNGGGRWLGAYYGTSTGRWFRECGFVFLAPQGTSSSETLNSSDTLSLETRVQRLEEWAKSFNNIK